MKMLETHILLTTENRKHIKCLLFREKYKLFLKLTAATCLKKVGTNLDNVAVFNVVG